MQLDSVLAPVSYNYGYFGYAKQIICFDDVIRNKLP